MAEHHRNPLLPTDISCSELLRRVCGRLGLAGYEPGSPAQLSYLAANAHRWLGYDTTPKALWALSGAAGNPPGLDPRQWWDSWLEHGTSGTCFATAIAFGWLLRQLGYSSVIDGWRLAGLNNGVGVHHATNRVALGDRQVLIELSSSVQVPLLWPQEGQASSDPGRASTLSCVAGRYQLHTPRAADIGLKLYELVVQDMTLSQMLGYYQEAVSFAPAAQTRVIVARTRLDGRVVSMSGRRQLVRRGMDVLNETDLSRADQMRTLEYLGFSSAWVAQLDSRGAFT